MARFVREAIGSGDVLIEDDYGQLFSRYDLIDFSPKFGELASALDDLMRGISDEKYSAERFPITYGDPVVVGGSKPPIRLLVIDCDGTITGPNFLPYIVGETIKDISQEFGVDFDQNLFDWVF